MKRGHENLKVAIPSTVRGTSKTLGEYGIFQIIGLHDNKWYKMYAWNSIQDCHGKSSIQQEEDSFHQKIGLQFKEGTSKLPHLKHNFFWCWNFNISDSRLEMPGKIWNVVLERSEKISWTDLVRNEGVIHRVKEERTILHTTKEERLTGLVTSCIGTALWNTFLKVGWREGWTWREDEEEEVSSSWMTLKKRKDTEKLKEDALDRTLWRTRFGRVYGPVIRQNEEWKNRSSSGNEWLFSIFEKLHVMISILLCYLLPKTDTLHLKYAFPI